MQKTRELNNARATLAEIARQHGQLPWSEKRPYLVQQAEQLGMSVGNLYRALKRELGWDSGRKPRADKGQTSVSEHALQMAGALKKTSIRLNGKVTMGTPVAMQILSQNDVQIGVSASRVNRLLKERRLDVESQKQATAHVTMRSLHPNHVHQADPSLCLIYYMKGKQHILRDDEVYKNKLDKIAAMTLKVYRYVLVDHASGYIVPWYIEAKGESQDNLFQFLMYAWGQQSGRPFHGVPEYLIWDKGSSNQSHAIQNMLDALQVKHIAHTRGNSRAKGAVEVANNIVETQFECRLRQEECLTVEALNAAATAWANAYNANLLPNQDTRLRRSGMSATARLDLWLTIRAEQLRILPGPDVCAQLMRGSAVTRVVRGDLTVTYKHPQADVSCIYDLRECDGICVKDSVDIRPLVYGDCAIVVSTSRYDGTVIEHRLEPISDFGQYGFRQSDPVWGEEFQSKPDTVRDTQAKRLDKVAYGDRSEEEIKKARDKNARPFSHLPSGGLDAISHLQKIELPEYMPRRGTTVNVGLPTVEAAPIPLARAAKQLRDALGDSYSADVYAWLSARYPDGVPDEETLDRITRDWTPQTLTDRPKLVAVGGR